MADDFGTMVARIAGELNRSNITTDIQNAINDAIYEAANTRFHFNEYRGMTFQTVIGQEYYDDLGFVYVDSMWWLNGTSRWNMTVQNNNDMNKWALGTTPNGPPTDYSRYNDQFRLYPIPNIEFPMNVEGFGRLLPFPLVNDTDSNAWTMSIFGERYIRALAKRNVLTEKIRDFEEAAIQDAKADSLLTELLEATSNRQGTGRVTPTTF